MEYAATYTEAELVHGLRARDQKIFSYLYDQYSPALYGVIVKVLNDDSSAGDILQEVYLKIWRHIDTYDEAKGRLFTWMLNIARNTAIDVLRSRSYKLEQKVQHITTAIQGSHQLSTTQPSIDHLGFSRILEKLTREQRTLIDLAYYKGCTQEEIARVLEVPLGTVKTRMRNAIMQLRNILNK
ncbi:RNA polymerase sigma factor [Chitinophaga nivalis]|uniref:Sigma-70 family RNA polymerase sigma factor n=1 Tax=Chitinophaga nivalis TaxID=2991709 RepID=A0ABT3IGB1_9BACT|nr:sigma-70 family RNA polymerase sigma factor [Chitinophaga nivalis]MCW3467494.1 sigma-70 family RNA polymerase sigma factor [Chitinophaga nivalis]MCW3482814.1 sigma-70 family RNA polymerase sigma factor [Chitinophaga nivalis]